VPLRNIADFKVPEGFKFDEKALTEATAASRELASLRRGPKN